MKTNLQKLIAFSALVFLLISTPQHILAQASGQDSIAKQNRFLSMIDLGASLKSRYIWRGINLGGHTASIQPFLELNFAKGWAVGAWAAYSLGEQPNQEVDLYLSYTTPGEKLSFLLTDYFFPDYSLRNNHYFEYDEGSGHVFELMVTLSPFDDFPVSFSAATNFYGADKKKDDEGNVLDQQSFSTYLQADYTTSLYTVDLDFFVAGVVANQGGYYGPNKNAFINVGVTASKSLSITDRYAVPLETSLIFNPGDQNIFLVFGMTI